MTLDIDKMKVYFEARTKTKIAKVYMMTSLATS